MLTYQLDRDGGRCLYEQLYLAVRRDIESGAIEAGRKLPSKRELARHLGVSVITVEAAYGQLAAEGYVRSRERSGVFANDVGVAFPRGNGRASRNAQEGRASEAAGRPAKAGADGRLGSVALRPASPIDLTGRSAGAHLFPYSAWARIQRRVLADCGEEELVQAGQAQGSEELRRAIAGHLRGFRGMDVSPDQVVVGAGAQVLYPFIVQLLGRDRLFALENPGYRRLAQVYAGNDVAVVPVPIDRDGISVSALSATGASVAHCMPAHQLPGGMVLPASRRRELLRWARGEGGPQSPKRYIVEDDYDCEFRMKGRPVAPLQAIDEDESVIYANTFTRTLGPALRMAYLVLPPHLADAFRERLGFYSCTASATDQLTLARFIASGEFERHVNRLRTGYRRVQDALVAGLRACKAAPRLSLHQVGAGLHFLVEAQGVSGPEAAARLRQEGVAVEPLEAFELRLPPERSVRFSPEGVASPTCSAPHGKGEATGALRGTSGDAGERGQAACESGPGVLVVNFSGLPLQDVAPVAEAFERAFS